MSPGEKVERLVEYWGITVSRLARDIGESRQKVNKWVSGQTTPRDAERGWAKIADRLGIALDDLMDPSVDLKLPEKRTVLLPVGGESEATAVITDGKSAYSESLTSGLTVAIPVWRTVLGGAEGEEYFEDDDFEIAREMPAFYVKDQPERHILCIISGESMQPRIDSGERALVRLDPDVPTGHLVVARSPEGQNFIKKLTRNESNRRKELHSLNPSYPAITELNGWIIKGGVTFIQHDYEPGRPNIEWDEGRFLKA